MVEQNSVPVLQCEQLTRTVPLAGSVRILVEDISFSLQRGEVLAVLGPSGSGKTTLLRMLDRLDEPTSGRVLFHGVDHRQVPPQELRRRVGMVMQRAHLFPGTVAGNLQYGPRQQGAHLENAEIEALLEQVGLPGHATRDVSTLSGGEAQRIATARALANSPDVLLLDEPTSSLDEGSRREIERALCSLVRQRHLSCIWVTHDHAQARRVADHVLLLAAGHAVGHGPVAEVLDA